MTAVPPRIKPRPAAKPRPSKVGRRASTPTRIHKEADDLKDLLANDRIKPPPRDKTGASGADAEGSHGVVSSTHGRGGSANIRADDTIKLAEDARELAGEVATRPALKLNSRRTRSARQDMRNDRPLPTLFTNSLGQCTDGFLSASTPAAHKALDFVEFRDWLTQMGTANPDYS